MRFSTVALDLARRGTLALAVGGLKMLKLLENFVAWAVFAAAVLWGSS